MEFRCSECGAHLSEQTFPKGLGKGATWADWVPLDDRVVCTDCWSQTNTDEIDALPEMQTWHAKLYHGWRGLLRNIRWRVEHFGARGSK